ncbi:MAG TPA: hypothetical protein VLW51_05570 [Solirubrobacteraceae bacterium]|nr:hypothetical protein [Solirubrobacteraceae bacterium]
MPLDGAAVDVEVDPELALELDDGLLLLLPHAAIVTTHDSRSAASSDFLQVTIRLLLT